LPQLVRHIFGPEGAAYVRRYLEANRDYPTPSGGCHIGGRLLAHHAIDRGVVWSAIPDTASPEYIEHFESGGVFHRSGLWKRDGLRPWLTRRLSDPGAVVAAEDVIGRKADVFTQRPDLCVFFCGEGLYRFAPPGAVEQALGMSNGDIRWCPQIAIITTARELAPGRVVSPAWVDDAAAAATAIMVGAWDEEGVVCWEPR
jgi:hypothetical protein